MQIVKICSVHGPLTADQATKEKGVYHRCKLCRKETALKGTYVCNVHGPLTIDQVYTHGVCKECCKKRGRDFKKNNRNIINERVAKDKLKNPEKWDNINKKQYQDRKNKYGDLYSLKKICDLRGITLEDYSRMIVKQDNKCCLCHLEETRIDGRTKMKQRLVLDHCHKTNKFRGLICHACNLVLGKLDLDRSIAFRYVRYLKQGGFNDL